MTRRSKAIERCELELAKMGLTRDSIAPLTEIETRILECFDKLTRNLSVSELYELECILHHLMKYWIEGVSE